MTDFSKSIDRFLSKFSYAAKMRSIITMGLIPVICLLIFLILTQIVPIQNLEKQLVGIDQQVRLNKLLVNLGKLELAFFSQPSKATEKNPELIDIISSFESTLQIFKEQALKENKFESGQKAEFLFMINKLEQRWIKAKRETHQFTTFEEFTFKTLIDEVLELMDLNRVTYHLNLNLDQESHFLIDAVLVQLSRIEGVFLKMLEILPFVKAETFSLEKETEFFVLRESLQGHLRDFSRDLSAIMQGQGLRSRQGFNQLSGILDIEKIVGEFEMLILQSEPSLYIFVDKINDVVQISDKVESSFLPVLRNLLQNHLSTLYFRECLSIGIIIIGILAIMIMYMTKVVRRPLDNLKIAAEELAQGNLSVRVPITSQDEVAVITVAFNEMAEFFEKTMSEVKKITNQLVENAHSLFEASKEIESNIANQDNAIHLISHGSKGFAMTMKNFTSLLKDVNKSARITSSLANLGRSSLSEMENIMHQMVDASGNIVSTLSLLKEQVTKINSIISAIVRIADQSNLLSLNTAIRASKTGQKGIGFTVVAERIRELANQTANATLEIEEAVQEIVHMVANSVQQVDHFSAQVQIQVDDDKNVSERLKALIGMSQEQIQMFDSINLGIENQFKQAYEIHDFIAHLVDATQHTTHAVRKLYREIEFLYHSTQSLSEETQHFTTDYADKQVLSD